MVFYTERIMLTCNVLHKEGEVSVEESEPVPSKKGNKRVPQEV